MKLIFLDIDGTLTEPGTNTPPESALTAIRAAQRNGHRVFLCTGRNLDMLRPLLQYSFDGAVASAGGYVFCGDRVIVDRPMNPEDFRDAMACFERNHIFRTVECRDGTYADGNPDILNTPDRAPYLNSELIRFRRMIAENLGMRPMEDYDGAPVYKIVFACADLRQLDEPMAVLGERFRFCIQNPDAVGCINGEILPHGIDKGRGVAAVCQHLGCDLSDTVGFGDSVNDKEMLESVGCAVCMANGHPDMQALADYVCPAVDEDGLYKAFSHLGLI
jgi:hypothetical protein